MNSDFLNRAQVQLAQIWEIIYSSAWETLLGLKYVALAIILFSLVYAWGHRDSLSWDGLREYFFPSRFMRAKTHKMDFISYFLYVLVLSPFIILISALVMGGIVADLLNRSMGSVDHVIEPLWLLSVTQFVAIALITNFFSWLSHYLAHKVPVLWELHKVHHSTEALNFVAAMRTHPLSELTNQVPFSCIMAGGAIGGVIYATGGELTPLAATLIVSLGVATLVFGEALSHTHAPISFGWFDRILMSPRVHQIHHSIEPHHWDKNFSTGIMVWDWIFGTLYLPKKGEDFEIGLSEEHERGENNPHLTFKGFYVDPAVNFARGVRNLVLPERRGFDSGAIERESLG